MIKELSHDTRADLLSKFHRDYGFLPTHFIDINLKKARHNLFTYLVNTDDAEREFHRFRVALSKKCFSKTHYRRFRRLVDACANAEISSGGRPHIHSAFRCPDHIDHQKFDELVMKSVRGNDYFLQDTHAVKIMHTSDMTTEHLANKIPYNGKDIDGYDAYRRDHARHIFCEIFVKYRKSRTDYRAFT